MRKSSRQLLTEILWLTLSPVLTILLALFFAGQSIVNDTLDLHLHDTYFVMSRWQFLTPLFLSVTFVLYFIKTRIKNFTTTFSYWVLTLSGLTLAISLTRIIKTLSQFATGGLTLYPPLSAIEPDKISELKPDPLSVLLANFLTVVQLIILVITLTAVYRWGKRNQMHNKHL